MGVKSQTGPTTPLTPTLARRSPLACSKPMLRDLPIPHQYLEAYAADRSSRIIELLEVGARERDDGRCDMRHRRCSLDGGRDECNNVKRETP
jgi:hypothetical protein